MFAALIYSLILFAAEPAATPPPAPATASSPTASSGAGKSDPNRLICKRESVPGSRFTTKTCRTLAEWEQIAEDARTVTRDIQSGPNLPNCNGGGRC